MVRKDLFVIVSHKALSCKLFCPLSQTIHHGELTNNSTERETRESRNHENGMNYLMCDILVSLCGEQPYVIFVFILIQCSACVL